MKRYLLHTLFVFGCLAVATPVSAAELVTIKNVTLVEADLNDGDSFKVRAGGRDMHLRLYYVDCLETTYNHQADQDRIREQQDYFGLAEPHVVVRFGRRATEYVQRVLSRPFTVHTSHVKAMGRSTTGRVYAFVTTSAGRDLGHLLVEQGLARIHGVTRPSPDNMPSDFVIEDLRALNAKAMLNKAGIWAEADPDAIADRRRRQREEKQARQAFRDNLKQYDAPSTANPMDLNVASRKQLESIPGVGPVMSIKIIDGRPYRSVEDLLKISGIGKKTLANITPYVTVRRRP